MNIRFRQFLLILLCSFPSAACNKAQAPAGNASSVPVLAPPSTQAPPQPSSAKAPIVHFTAEVTRGERFEKSVAPGMIFRLEPYAGNDWGWSIRLAPSSEPSPASVDCIGAVFEPMHGSNELELEPPNGATRTDAEFKRTREFIFVPTPSDCKEAWDLMNAVNYPSKLTDKERDEAGQKLGKILTRNGMFKVIDFRRSSPTGQGQQPAIDWLKFEVELRFAASSGAPVPAESKKANSASATVGDTALAQPAISLSLHGHRFSVSDMISLPSEKGGT